MSETLNLETPIYVEADAAQAADPGTFDSFPADFDSALATTASGTEKTGGETDGPEKEDNAANESKKGKITDGENWDAALFSFVSANANELVMLGGAEMTLSAAMFLIPITKETVGAVLAQAQRLVAEAQGRKAQESEEGAAEETAQDEHSEQDETASQKKDDKTEVKAAEKNVEKTDEKPEAKKDLVKAEQTPQMVRTVETLAPKTGNHVKTVESKTAPSVAKVEAASATVEPSGPKAEPVGSAPEVAVNITKASLQTVDLVGEKVEIPAQDLLVDQPVQPAEDDTVLGSDVTEFFVEDTVDTLPPPEDEFFLVLDDAERPAIQSQPEIVDLVDFVEGDELLISQASEPVPPTTQGNFSNVIEVEPGLLDMRPVIGLDTLDTAPEHPQEMDLVDDEEIDSTSEIIGQPIEAQIAEKEKVDRVMDKIEAMAAALMEDNENLPDANAEHELEEIFVELLESLEIDYTPEVVESLVQSVINNNNWQAQVMGLIDKKGIYDQPQHSVTHEAIPQIIMGRADDKTTELGGVIGMWALELCSFSLVI